MTNFSLSSVLKPAAVALAALLAGCDTSDGSKEFEAGKAAYGLTDLVKAEKCFNEACECCPTNVDMLVHLARTELDLGKLPEAERAIVKAEAEAGGDLDVRQLSAQIAWHRKDYAKALRIFKGIADDAGLDAATRAEGWNGIGIVKMTVGEAHSARIAFLRAIRIDGRNPSARYHLGLVYRDSPFGYNEAALEQFQIYVRLEKLASPRVQKVQRSVIPGLKELIARTASERPGVAKRNSSASAAALVQAQEEMKKNRFKQARAKFEEALKADPLSFPAATGLAKAILKTDASKAGQQRAFEKMKLACTLNAGAVNHFMETADLAVKLGLNAQAVEIYSRALAFNPTSAAAVDGLVKALRRTGGKAQQALAREYLAYRESLPRRK